MRAGPLSGLSEARHPPYPEQLARVVADLVPWEVEVVTIRRRESGELGDHVPDTRPRRRQFLDVGARDDVDDTDGTEAGHLMMGLVHHRSCHAGEGPADRQNPRALSADEGDGVGREIDQPHERPRYRRSRP